MSVSRNVSIVLILLTIYLHTYVNQGLKMLTH